MKRIVTLLVAALCAGAAWAGDAIKFGVPDAIAPFVLPSRDSGLLVDIFREALATQGAGAEFVYLPSNRTDEALRTGWVDVVSALKTAPPATGVPGHWPVTHFHNVAITLKVRIPRLAMDDLSRYRVSAFRGASKVLGTAYQEATADNPSYRELPSMPSALLMLGQVDVVISQPDIFRYYLTRQAKFSRVDDNELAFHDILGKGVDYWFQFRTAEQRDVFERGIAALYKSGAVDKIFDRYRREYGTTREFFRPLDCQFLAAKPRGCAGDTGKPS